MPCSTPILHVLMYPLPLMKAVTKLAVLLTHTKKKKVHNTLLIISYPINSHTRISFCIIGEKYKMHILTNLPPFWKFTTYPDYKSLLYFILFPYGHDATTVGSWRNVWTDKMQVCHWYRVMISSRLSKCIFLKTTFQRWL